MFVRYIEVESSLVCILCKKSFFKNTTLKRHVQDIHKVHVDKVREKQSLICPICKYEVFEFEDFKEHTLNVHDVTIKSEKLEFPSEAEFHVWKNSLELKDNCLYIRKHAPTNKVDNSVSVTFNCNRSGTKLSPEASKKELQLQGSCKINGYCPSMLKVLFNNDHSVSVLYYSTHIGHKQDLAHKPLKPEECKEFSDNEKEAILKEMCFTRNENEGVCVTEDMKMELINEFSKIVECMNNYKQYIIVKKSLKRLKSLLKATKSTNMVSVPTVKGNLTKQKH